MSDLPALWALNEASKAAGLRDWTTGALCYYDKNGVTIKSIVAHARTTEKYEQPPVDPDLIWARQWALNTYYSGIGVDNLVLGGSKDADACVQAAYSIRKACREEWRVK